MRVLALLGLVLCASACSLQNEAKESKLVVTEVKCVPETPGAKKSIYAVKAVKLLQAGDGQGAIKTLNEGIAKDPTHVELYILRATLHGDDENYKSALKDYDKAITLTKDPHVLAQIYLCKALMKRISKQYKDYDLDFRKAMEIDPTLAVAQYEYGELLLKIGKGKEAIPYLEKAKELFSKEKKSKEMITEIDALLKKAKGK